MKFDLSVNLLRMFGVAPFVDGVVLSKEALFKTLSNRLVQVRLRDQMLVLLGCYVLLFVSSMPVLLPLSMFGLVSVPNVLWSMLSSTSVVGIVVRTVAFPISLHAVSPLFASELFLAVMQDVSPTLFEKMRTQPSDSTPMRVWLPVHLARALPLLLLGSVLWIATKFPLVGPLFAALGNFAVAKSVIGDTKAAALAALAIFVTGALGASLFKVFLTARSLGAEQCDLYLYRVLEADLPSADASNAAMRQRYKNVLSKRRQFYKHNLAFVVGFALPFALVLLLVPLGFAIYVVAMGAAAVLANHIHVSSNSDEVR